MTEIQDYHDLIMAIDAIDGYRQTLPLPANGNTDLLQLIEATNRLLERLAAQYRSSDSESNSLAAASVRMVLLTDVQERLNQADKLVKSPKDLKEFFQVVLSDLVDMIGARSAIYISKEIGSSNKNILVHGIDDSTLTEFKRSASFQQFISLVSTEKNIVNRPDLSTSTSNSAVDRPILAAPLWINNRLTGIIFLIDKIDQPVFNRDDLSVFELLLPDILRVLERIELLFALENSNRSLHAEQLKQQALTEEVRQTMGFLESAHETLKKSFITSIRVFSNLIEMREGRMAGHSHRVADIARTLAQRMGMQEGEAQDVFFAALLHDVGKIGLSDVLIEKPFSALTSEERTEVVKHPAKGEAALLALEQLQVAAKYIRGHHERFDGLGYPDKLAGLMIPLGARILAVANDFDSVQLGTIVNKHLTKNEALAYIQEGRGNRYDPAVVDAFLGRVAEKQPTEATNTVPELMLRSLQLSVGMVLSRDMIGTSGNLMLSKDYVLNEQVISQIKNFERIEKQSFTIWVYAKK